LGAGETVGGLTVTDNPFITYTAFDRPLVNMQEAQLWELGNALAMITGKQIPDMWNTKLGTSNNEPGHVLLDCVKGH
jgi:hypothetical protein